MSGYRYGFNWCSCPHCPSNEGRQAQHGLRYLPFVPSYATGHRHGICEWCNIWQNLMPGYEILPFYRRYNTTFEAIHDFFRGGIRFPPQKVALAIRDIAEYIHEYAQYEMAAGRWLDLAGQLDWLADDVERGLAEDRYWSRFAGSGPWYRTRLLGFGR
ncbi:Hypothetical predicted protein [Lecanosticta acicola]|uniref:Uncharacterized protein n=1 Tax=Lecanosticta acicola TaxID=111012 RepID=A0AAI8Z0B6_9PEZI|nr:Hypothetical predicted protein [Lecanosticta acicola]